MKQIQKQKLDKDTRELLSEQEKIKLLTEHEGWAIVRQKFLAESAKMLNLAHINIQQPLGGSVGVEIMVKQLASAALLSVLNDIQGTAEQFNSNEALAQTVENNYVIRPPVKSPLGR